MGVVEDLEIDMAAQYLSKHIIFAKVQEEFDQYHLSSQYICAVAPVHPDENLELTR